MRVPSTPGVLRVGIVGSRRRNNLPDRKLVFEIVQRAIAKYPDKKIIIVSGGCRKGADHFAEEAAKFFGVEPLLFPVSDDPPVKSRWEYRERAFARNYDIAANSDIVFALVHEDRTGGTENTVEHCDALRVPCVLV